MDRNLAERLVEELETHPPLTTNVLPNRDYFINLLVNTHVPPSSRFYEKIRENSTTIPDNAKDQFHILSMRRILRNNRAIDYRLSRLKKRYESLASALGVYDSDVFTRRLRTDRDIVALMAKSAQSYTLLAKLDTYDEFSGKVATRPLVIIPDVQDLSKILAWEDANTIYAQEGLFGTTKISKKQYLKS